MKIGDKVGIRSYLTNDILEIGIVENFRGAFSSLVVINLKDFDFTGILSKSDLVVIKE